MGIALLFFLAALASPSTSAPIVDNAKRQDQLAGVFPDKSVGLVIQDYPTDAPIPPPGASGSLYGSTSLAGYDGNPINPDDSAIVPNPTLVPGQKAPTDEGVFLDFSDVDYPQPIRGTSGMSGGTDNGPDTSRYTRFSSDMFARPGTDKGSLPNAQWPLGLSTNRLGLDGAGWARQQNTDQLPAATDKAGVDMKLSPWAYRELHWHAASEWAFIFKGSARIATVNENGQTFVDDLNEGDVWLFPAGVPHSIQAFDKGVEFLLVFDEGNFSEDSTALVTEMFLRTPLSVLAKDLKTDVSSFKNIPQNELYIFNGSPAPFNISAQNVTGAAGSNDQLITQYSYHWSQQEPLVIPGAGTVKFLDATIFPSAADFAAALVTIEPGAMRELHWHPTSDEWTFFMAGSARITIYQPPESSQTFDYGAGDVAYIPQTFSHYIENTSNETVVLLEMLQASKFTDVSAAQWLGLTPKQIVKDTLNLPDSVLDNLPTYKPILISGSPNLTETNFTAPF